jgi:hypothetical protein
MNKLSPLKNLFWFVVMLAVSSNAALSVALVIHSIDLSFINTSMDYIGVLVGLG